MIAVIAAHRDGKTIQFRSLIRKDKQWTDAGDIDSIKLPPAWNFGDFEYRIKPVPSKPREWIMPIWAIEQYKKTGPKFSDSENLDDILVIEVLPSSGEPPLTQPRPTASP